ncbi:T9SS type A sorting domain-containing protein, partial [candidate division KSB1 bacterium]|nr:T9SS type A sorting domain-containing protein [candidate division KSB1 bacterium]
VINVPPGRNTLPDAVEAGGFDDVFVLQNQALYEISKTIELVGNQKITTEHPCQSFQDQAIVQSFGTTIMDVAMRAQHHFYDFPGDFSDPGGRWFWLPVGLASAPADPNDPDYAGPHAGSDGTTITLTGMKSATLEGETYLNAWDDDANPEDFERINTYVEVGIRTNGTNIIEGVEMRGFRFPFEASATSSHLTMFRCKWIASKTGVRIYHGGLYMNTCWGSGGSQRVHMWRHIKSSHLRDAGNQGKRQILAGQNVTGDVILENCGFYDMFDGVLGHYPNKLEIKNCLFDSPRCDDAIQIGIGYGSVWSYRTIFVGTGPSWNQDGTNSNPFVTEECILNPGRELYRAGSMRDRRSISKHNQPEDPHDFIRCTFFNHNPVNSAGNEFDEVLGAGGRGAAIGPHRWHDCLIYRTTREGRACAKLGKFYEQGLTDIQGTVIVDANSHNDSTDAFFDGGSFDVWKTKNDPNALYLTDYSLTEEVLMADPGFGAIMAGREVGAVPLDATTPYGNVGPGWLIFTELDVRNVTMTGAELYWDAIETAISYEVGYRKQNDASWMVSTDILSNQVFLTDLIPNTSYEWRMRYLSVADTSVWASGPRFTTLIDSSLQFVSITLVDSVAAEQDQDSAVVALTRNSTAGDLKVFLEFSGTASADDFDALADSVVFSAGDSVVQVVFTPIDDEDIEGWQILEVAIAKNQNYNCLSSQKVKLMLLDNDRFESDKMFIEAEGEVVMEAEHFHINDMRLDPSTNIWEEGTDEPGYVGSGYISTLSGGTLAAWENACEVGYNIKFSTTGTFHVWLRRYSFINEPNTVWVGMDGVQSPNQGNDNMPVYNPFEKWMWVNIDSIQVSTIEEIHTFNVRRCENNYRLDRIVLRTASDIPSGDGPAESVQTDVWTPVEDEETTDTHALPEEFALHQNYPNPFNPSTKISFALPQKANVTVDIYDVLGKKVTTLFFGLKTAGYHTISWNAAGNSSGLYFYRLNARGTDGNNFSAMGKCILMK